MRKSTLWVLAIAVVCGALVYYFEWKRAPKPEAADESKPAFAFQPAEISGIRIQRGSDTDVFESNQGKWRITQPIRTEADNSLLEGLATSISAARITRTLPATPERMAGYGLANPAVTINFQLKNGAKHQIRLGAKDFSGIYAYGQIDGGKNVDLLPESLLNGADKPLDEFRDRSVLDLVSGDVSAFELKNDKGELSVRKKEESRWEISRPVPTAADSGEVLGLLGQIGSARLSKVVSEDSRDLSKYGLQHPAVVFTEQGPGGERSLELGKKIGDDYYARDSARSMIFQVQGELFQKLDVGVSDLRDKTVVSFQQADLTRVEIHNANQTIVAVMKNDKWTLEQPADMKGKEVQSWKFIDPLSGARAEEIYDHPAAPVAAKLAKPAVSITLTEKSGKTTKVEISGESGGAVYARTSAGPTVYKIGKQTLEDLNFKTRDILETK